jgi:hypothetical protein
VPPDFSLTAIVATIATPGMVAGCLFWLRNNGLKIDAGRLHLRWDAPKPKKA